MKNHSKSKRIAAFLLAAVIMLSLIPLSALAAVGDLSNVSTGIDGDIDTSDTISLPIQILDYEADGMLFEYAESKEIKDAVDDFGATYSTDFASLTSVSSVTPSMYGNFWSCTTNTLNTTNSSASFLRATWAGNTTNAPFSQFGTRAGIIMPNDLSSYSFSMDSIRYLVLVYRSNVTSGSIGFWVERSGLTTRTNTNNSTGNLTFTSEGKTNWTYAVYDLKQGKLGNTWSSYGTIKSVFTSLPIDASGEYIDIAHVALFSDKTQAKKFGEYALTDGSDRGDNRAFGLLRNSRTESGGTNYAGIIDETDTVTQINTYNGASAFDYSTIENLGYSLLGTFAQLGIANIGLLESGLSDEGYPVYKEEVVSYLAGLLEHSLEISERTSDGWKNYRYVKGTASSIYGGTDLATALRNKINGTTGSYAAASAKDLVGTWDEVSGNIASYYDAAYFLLNSIFVDGSYNEPQDDYNYLVLSAATDSDTDSQMYVFDAGFTTSTTPSSAEMAINYDTTTKTIQNSCATGKSHFVYEGTNTTTLNPFLPVTDKNNSTSQTNSVYYQDDGVISTSTTKDTYINRNFNYALYSNAEFVYYADEELFFDFEGDDDVYLFINGELVMDIGSAHSIDGVRFDINEYVEWARTELANGSTDERAQKLALVDGNTYSFSFYYMERHGYGSNMRIATNIKFTDPSMGTQKYAYQDGSQIEYGNVVDKDNIIEYGFSITNNGLENLYNLTYDDPDIGVSITYSNGLTVSGERVTDLDGGTLDASDLVATVSLPATDGYDEYEVTFADNSALKAFLVNPTESLDIDNPHGLWSNGTVSIRGIGYTLSESQIAEGVFDNTVLTSSTNSTKSTTLYGQAAMRVFVPSDPMYYEWAGHDLVVDKTKLINDVLSAAQNEDNVLNGKVANLTVDNVNKIEFSTSKGYTATYSDVTLDSDYTLTISYPQSGAYLFYVKVTYNSSKSTVVVPVPVYVTDVEDSVFVLDYGLDVELTQNDQLFANDDVSVPGRNTLTKVWGVSGETPSYSPNNISFSVNDTNTVDGTYGDFSVTDNNLRYDPDEFMEGADSVYVAVGVYEDGESNNKLGDVNINKEVQMYKSVTTLPANVVYYEDNFPAISYNSSSANTIETVTDGNEYLQSADQSEQYGHDSAYENTSEDEYSAGSLTKITIGSFDTVASFTFKGTGFELIGRTNATDSATLVIKVLNSDGTVIKTIPVITEYDNYDNEGDEEIYQVPVIRVSDLSETAQTYTVQIMGVPARDYANYDGTGEPAIIPTVLYIDGIRIYQPVEGVTENGTVLEDLYISTEQNVTFLELRNQIIEGNIAVAEYNTTDGIQVSTSTSTWTENLSGEYLDEQLHFNEVASVSDYLLQGPNNEVYMTGTYDNAALVLYVRETDSDTHSLQLALRGIDECLFFAGIENDAVSSVDAVVRVGVYDSDSGEYKWDDIVNCTSSTEQYYTIDYTDCYYDESKLAYQVVIRVDSGMISFTSLKLTGLELVSIDGDKTDLKYENGILMQNVEDSDAGIATASWVEADASSYVSFYSVSRQMSSTALVSDETEAEPDDSENDSSEDTDSDSMAQVKAFLERIFAWILNVVSMIKKFFGF